MPGRLRQDDISSLHVLGKSALRLCQILICQYSTPGQRSPLRAAAVLVLSKMYGIAAPHIPGYENRPTLTHGAGPPICRAHSSLVTEALSIGPEFPSPIDAGV